MDNKDVTEGSVKHPYDCVCFTCRTKKDKSKSSVK